MKTTGIIAEYNPFHNGHKYHLEKARELTGCDYVVVIMSGDYTQRGTPAIYSKYVRAKAALLSGADLVLEMPVFGSVASAPDFSRCGVRSLDAAGVCDYLFFGSESGDVDILYTQASSLSEESEEISEKIKAGLKSGLPFPAARANAYGKQQAVTSLPNDILGIEYIRAIQESHASLKPVTIRRTDPGYHSEEKSGSFASATAARKAILENN
ncbi:MAG: nucleotidyltransferase family protein, partial [Lachnospiraceae bacterium]|nr:nucleotidyltransferase family protein [Lachnospiraceae bacterium]